MSACSQVKTSSPDSILIPRAHDPFGQHQGSRPLAGPEFLNMRRSLVLYFQPIKFVRFDNESVNLRLAVLDPARGLDPWC